MRVSVVTPPAALLSAPDAKRLAPVLADDEDLRVDALLRAAQSRIERSWIGRAFGRQTLELRLDGFGAGEVALPWPPLRAVLAVAYRDEGGQEWILDPAAYRTYGLGTDGGRIAPAGGRWPRVALQPEAVRIRYEAGFPDADPALEAARQAVVLIATHLRSLSTRELGLRGSSVEGIGSHEYTLSDVGERLIRSAVEDLLADLVVWSC